MGSDWRQYANFGRIVLAKKASIVSGENTCGGGGEEGREVWRERAVEKGRRKNIQIHAKVNQNKNIDRRVVIP